MPLQACEKVDPSKWNDCVVRAVHSRLSGVKDDPACGCMVFMESHDTPKSSIARSFLINASSPPASKPVTRRLCRTCERLSEYEGSIKEQLASDFGVTWQDRFSNAAESSSTNKLSRRRSSGDAPSEMRQRLAGFALLAPPIGVGSDALKDVDKLIFDSAARLLFALTSLKAHLEKRLTRVLGLQGNVAIKDHSKDEGLWYISQAELEHMFIMSGVNWMTRDQLKQTFSLLDLNSSGNLHMTEMAEVLKTTKADCLDILKNRLPPFEVRRYILRLPGEPVGGSLRQQLRSQFES